MRRKTLMQTLATISVIGSGVSSAIASTIDTDEIARLASREVVISVVSDDAGADGIVDAAIDVAAPRARVWPVLLDCARAPNFMPALKSCSVLSKDPSNAWDVREHRVSWTDFLPDTRNVFRSEYIKETSIRFTRVEGDLSILDGEWQLEPLDGGTRTRLHYRARIGIDLPVPSFLIRGALERDVPNFLKALRAEIEQPAN